MQRPLQRPLRGRLEAGALSLRVEAERAQAHQTLLPLVQNPQPGSEDSIRLPLGASSRCMPQLQFVLAHTSSGAPLNRASICGFF